MTDRDLMQQALEALEEINKLSIGENAICLPAEIDGAMDALRERLAQPEPVQFKCTVVDDDHPDGVPLSKWGRHPDQEPFCYHDGCNIVGKEFADHSDVFPLYTAPPPLQWQGLTDEEKIELWNKHENHWRFEDNLMAFTRAIEAKLREKNT